MQKNHKVDITTEQNSLNNSAYTWILLNNIRTKKI